MLDAEFFSESLENSKKLLAERARNRKVAEIITCAGGVIDLDNEKLLRALHATKRDNTDGWLEWEKKHALAIGLSLDEEEPVANESPVAKKQNVSSSTPECGVVSSPPP